MNDTTLLGWTVPSHISWTLDGGYAYICCHWTKDVCSTTTSEQNSEWIDQFLRDHAHGQVVEHHEAGADSALDVKVECPDMHCAASFRGATDSAALGKLWDHLRDVHGAVKMPECVEHQPAKASGNCVGRLCAYERALTEEYPDGIEEDSDTLPDPARAAQRVGDFLRVYGDARVCVAITPLVDYQIPPLYGRDLQALVNVAERQPPADNSETVVRAIALHHLAVSEAGRVRRQRNQLQARIDKATAYAVGDWQEVPATTPPDRSGRFVGDEFHPLTDLDGRQPTHPEAVAGD